MKKGVLTNFTKFTYEKSEYRHLGGWYIKLTFFKVRFPTVWYSNYRKCKIQKIRFVYVTTNIFAIKEKKSVEAILFLRQDLSLSHHIKFQSGHTDFSTLSAQTYFI